MLEELKKLDKNLEILFIGSGEEIEQKVLKGAGIKYESIPAGKFRRYNRGFIKASLDIKTNWQNLTDFFRANRGVVKTRKIIKKFKPDIIFIKGGYVGLPVGIAARSLKIPFINHESDIVPGITNRYLSHWAIKTAVGFPTEFYKNMNKNKLVFVGNPLRSSAISGNKLKGLEFFNLNKNKPIIFIFGGSRGAQAINYLVFENLKLVLKKYQLIHITGESDIKRAQSLHDHLDTNLKTSYHPFSFLADKIGLAYATCDITVARAGANTIAEIAAWSKPAIIIPLHTSANDHQNVNGQILARSGAARVISQSRLTSLRLISEIDKLWASKRNREYLSKMIAKFEKKDASYNLAKLIYEIGKPIK
ncbi:MAG: UDP-N-acetylglucosamine--N-acetylmuramyl-(pentapeptide) pyrophosphoryl-undecaprenol N-acetylglucosamine transferase [bacterium]|nr:UDP-N-acetylglucosamine--N-acetylmuramyl-(pentapeptide) pyrophosphoryl-undecaprenol N-acetylglucosamine transferase [bacterium]